MSKFSVGQRVRIVSAFDLHGSQNVGQIGEIAGPEYACWWSNHNGRLMYPVVLDGVKWCYSGSQMEPIDDYDGNKATSWDLVVWQPKQVRA